MLKIKAGLINYKILNEQVKESEEKEILIEQCNGQRYIGCGLNNKKITIEGVPGNALGAYLNGADLVIKGNVQDATGDTMNDGSITVFGSSGDATGYAMRGGTIYIKGNVGYRAGIHMKSYKEKLPVLVIGGRAGNFLGEYQAGGIIIVLGLGHNESPVGYFCGTGMHGGKIYLRCSELPKDLPSQVMVSEASEEEMLEIKPYIENYCEKFGNKLEEIMNNKFYVLSANTKNPYHQLYIQN